MRSRPVSFVRITAILLAAYAPFGGVSGRPCVAAPPVTSDARVDANNPPVRLAPVDAQTLAGALRSVSNQTGLAFVAEGTPFRARGSAPPLVAIAEKWPAPGLPLDEAVQKIAGVYDYEAERKGNVFLFRKRYTNPNDLPEVTTEELRFALRDASRAASALPAPTVPPENFTDVNTPFMADLFHSLKVSQQPEGLRGTGMQGIEVNTLSARQKDALWQCAVSRHIQAATGTSLTAYKALQTMEQNTTVFSMQPVEGAQAKIVPVLSYRPKRLDNATFPVFAGGGHLWGNTPVPDDYDATGKPLPFSDPREEVETQTLQKWCESDGKSARFTVDPALAEKNVLIVTPSSLPADTEAKKQGREAVFRAVGAVYGLRVLHLSGDRFHIARAKVVAAQTLADLNTTVPSAFPEPLMRAFHGAAAVETAKSLIYYMKGRANELDFDPKKPNDAEKIFAKGSGRRDGATALQNAALRRFHVLTEPRVTSSRTVLFADLGREETRLLLLALASECLDDVDKLTDEMPAPTRKGLEQGRLQSITIENKYLYAGKVPKEMENTCRFIFYLHLSDNNGDISNGGHYTVGNVTVPIPPAKAE